MSPKADMGADLQLAATEKPMLVAHRTVSGANARLFVVHAPEDTWFVEGFLLEALRLPEGEVLLSSKLELGAVIVNEIERGAVSPVTVVVVSPAFLASPWAWFVNHLAMHQSIEAANDGSATLVPAILADCVLPLLSRFRVPLDFRNQDRDHWEAEAERLRKKVAAQAPVSAPLPCPYPGIRPFTTEDATRFHGRDKEVADLLGRLRDGQRELYVIGPSGSGKSSLVAAGLVPSLRQSPELAGGSFLVRQMRPGANPTSALTAVLEATAIEHSHAATRWLGDAIGRLLANNPGHDHLLIVVDQLEELFTTTEGSARAKFIAAIRALRGDPRIALVLTLRADFYASLMESALWIDLDGQLSRLDVSPLRGAKLRTAIEAPARSLGVYFEPVLVQRLLHDAADEPGALPLLQDTLLDLWYRRTRGLLRLAEYDAMSDGEQIGLAVTVARRANGALDELSPGRREIARRVLLRLSHFSDETATTRRQQTRAALASAGDAPEEIDTVIRHLADRRLITTSGGNNGAPSARVDLAHEILLSAWPELGEWIRSRREDEQRRRVLQAKAAEWVKSGRGQSRLLDADELREVRSWLSEEKARDLGVSEEIQSLLASSEAALAAQVAEAERQRSRWQQQLARNYVSQGHALLMSGHPAQAVPYLLAAREAGAQDVSLRTLFRWAAHWLPIRQLVHRGAVMAVTWSPDGSRVATASDDETARVWDANTGQAVTPPLTHHGVVTAIAWSPDGRRVTTASDDKTARVWDANSGQALTPPLAHDGLVTAVAWSPDGRRVATANWDKTAQVWDAVSGQAVTPPLAHHGVVWVVAWSPDGSRVATASWDKTARVWDAVSGEAVTPLLAHQGSVLAVAWSPDGNRVATASDDHTARVWDVISGQAVTLPFSHQGVVLAVAWSPDGSRVATASWDKTAQVWDAISGQEVTPPLAHQGWVNAVAWSPDGRRIATVSEDRTARIWDAVSGQAVTPPLAHQGLVKAVAWSPDSQRIATASDDESASVWDAVRGQAVTPSLAHQGWVKAVAWSPDGKRVATASDDKTARVWDAISGQAVMPPLVHCGLVNAVAWSPDGRRVVTASDDETARVWDAISGRAVTPPLVHQGWVKAVAWSPDGKHVATASWDKTARVWDAVSGHAVSPPLVHQGWIKAVAWSPDGRQVATASDDKTAQVWDAVSGHAVTPPLTHQGWVNAVAWSPDGRRVATASGDKTARVWDAVSGRAVTPSLAHQEEVLAVAWSPDGMRVATASRNGTARIWDAINGQVVTPPLAHRSGVKAVAWSPDGRRVATASSDKTARVWDAVSGHAVTPPLAHQGWVTAVAWSPDSRQVATASCDKTARVWDVSWDTGTLADWRAVIERCDYRLNDDGVLVARDLKDPAPSLPSSRAFAEPTER